MYQRRLIKQWKDIKKFDWKIKLELDRGSLSPLNKYWSYSWAIK